MNVPSSVRRSVEEALARREGRSVRINRATRVGGGCVSPVARIEMDDGTVHFLKWGAVETTEEARPGMLAAEAEALEAMGATGTVRVPEVIGLRDPEHADEDVRWLVMEWLEPGRPQPGTWGALGRRLAALHRSTGPAYGWDRPNFIGPLHQPNGRTDHWPAFWREARLEPQLRLAVDAGFLGDDDTARFHALFAELDDLLEPAATDGPSLVHGDLWNGNVHVTDAGTAALVDPSVYHGHREVDLAMSELFGGFGREFYDAYEEAWPVEPGYARVRRSIYQLYYLLVHVNLFGGGYVGSTRSTLAAAGF